MTEKHVENQVIIDYKRFLLYPYCKGSSKLEIVSLLKECGIGELPPLEALNNIKALKTSCTTEEFVAICNYILMTNTDQEILSGIVRFADEIRATSTLSILLDLLVRKWNMDPENYINLKVLCAKSISNYKDTSTVGVLLYCLNNKAENYKVRLACADALGRIGDPYAVASLINVVKDEEEKSVYVKESATFALGLIGDTSAIDPLVAIMEAKQGLWDKFSFLKEKIVEALGRLSINNAKVLKVFKTSLMDSSPIVRINTIEALMNSEYEEAPKLIRRALKDENEEVQRNALIALYNIEGRDILDEVISLPSFSKFLKEEAQNMIDEYEDEEE